MAHSAYLSGYAPKATQHHEWRDAQNSAPHLLPVLIEKASKTPNLSLLDVGAGSGTITASLAKYMPQGKVIAFDLSEEILEKTLKNAESVGVKNVEVKQGSVYALPYEDETFDIVHTSQMLVHLDDPVKALKEMVRVTKKSGGVVSLRESDLTCWSVYPDYPEIFAMNKFLCAVHEANGATSNGGSQLVSWAIKAGVDRSKIKASAGTWCYSTPEERQIMGGALVDKCVAGVTREKAIEKGIATEAELKQMAEGWKKWIDAEDGYLACMQGEALLML